MSLKKTKIKVGDVFPILSSEGVCYGQIIHTHPKYKYIIAVFREFFNQSPEDFTDVISKEPQFITAFLIDDAVKQGLFTIIDSVPVATHLQKFPIFRATNNLKGDDTLWFFWDGEKEWRVERPLTQEEKKYPEGPSFPSAPLLIEMVEKDYRVEKDYI